MLLELGADPDIVDKAKNSPLMHGAASNAEVADRLVQLMLQRNPQVNLQNDLGESAVYRAVAAGNNATLPRLKEAGD